MSHAFLRIWGEVLQLLEAPFINPEMIWIIIPLIVTLLVMTFYFGRYIKEELGWNTALANSVVLLFVAIDLFRYLFHSISPPSILAYQVFPIKTIVCIIIVIESITLMFSSFFKTFPKKITFLICSPLAVNIQAYIAVAMVYTNIQIDRYTPIAVILVFIFFVIIIKLLQFFERKTLKEVRKAKIEEIAEEKKKAREIIKKAAKKEKIIKTKAELENGINKKLKIKKKK